MVHQASRKQNASLVAVVVVVDVVMFLSTDYKTLPNFKVDLNMMFHTKNCRPLRSVLFVLIDEKAQ